LALVEDIAVRLSSQGVSSTTSTGTYRTVFNAFQPTTDVKQIAIIPTGGFPQEPNAGMVRSSFQLLIRSERNNSTDLEATVDAARNALNLFDGTINNFQYADIQVQGDGNWLGFDENDDPMYSLNFVAFRSRTT
jgi:hypothetical protein